MNRSRAQKKPHYGLSEVKKLIREGKVRIQGNALDGARDAFGWRPHDILDALGRLQSKHFNKSDVSQNDPHSMLDIYKARGLKGENVYTHFYIDRDTDTLIVNSFKEI